MLSSFVSYTVDRKLSKHPEEFGYGAIEGVAAPESANNASAQSAFIPLLTLGLPSNAVMAVMLGAMTIHRVIPGPMLTIENPDLFWGVIASMVMGNAMLLILNLPLIGMWVKVLRIPYRILFPLILLFCLIGAYSISYSVADVLIMVIFGVLGYLMKKFDYELTPLVLAFVLGPMLENAFQQSLTISSGSFSIFFTRPISAVGMALAVLLILSSFVPWISKRRSKVAREDEV